MPGKDRHAEPESVDLARYRRMGEEKTYLVGFEPGGDVEAVSIN